LKKLKNFLKNNFQKLENFPEIEKIFSIIGKFSKNSQKLESLSNIGKISQKVEKFRKNWKFPRN